MLAWVVDPWSTKYESVLRHVPSHHPKTRGNVSSIQKGSKSFASPSVLRQETQTFARQDSRAPSRAYAMN